MLKPKYQYLTPLSLEQNASILVRHVSTSTTHKALCILNERTDSLNSIQQTLDDATTETKAGLAERPVSSHRDNQYNVSPGKRRKSLHLHDFP